MSEIYREGWWFPKIKAQVLRKRVFPLVPPSGGIVEVGSWEGKSTCFIARAFAPRTILAIDPFTGGIADGTAPLTKDRNIQAEFIHNISVCAPNQVSMCPHGWRHPIAMRNAENLSPLALVYIDGEHTEVEVFDNVLAYVPLMVRRGVISGDDWGNRGVKRGAQRAAEHFGVEVRHSCSTWWMVF
jgi:hypothetical protein